MKKISLRGILYFFIGTLISTSGFGQVAISAELGGSYLPFTIYGANTVNESNRVDFLIGLSAQFRIHKSWQVYSRISYANREDIKWYDLNFDPAIGYKEVVHSDLNIDFSLLYSVNNFISLGAGASIIRKINSTYTTEINRFENTTISHSINHFRYGSNLSVACNVNRYGIKVMYIRLLNDGGSNRQYEATGRNRLDITFSVKIFGGA